VIAAAAAAAAAVAVWRSVVARRQAQEARKSRELSAVRATDNEDVARDLQEWIGAPDP
jgi:hypothetical protein